MANQPAPTLVARLRVLLPPAATVNAAERARAALGAALGIAFAAALSRWAGAAFGFNPWLVAPLGASAVLVFALPAGPLSQPWPVIGGNMLSALSGLVCAWALPDVALAGAAAVGLAIVLMFALRCLHPPGGGIALLAVLTHNVDAQFVLLPVLLNSVLLVLAGVVYNTLSGRRYPHRAPVAAPAAASRFTRADFDAAIAHHNQVLEMSRDDLEALLQQTEAAAYRRTLGELRCADIMSRAPLAAVASQGIDEAWQAMRARHVKALPVTDNGQRVVGIVTLADFMRQGGLGPHDTAVAEPRPQQVGEIMTRKVRVASDSAHVIALLPLFSEGGHHHLPVIDGEQRLVGIITQSDVVRALHRAVQPPQTM